MLKRNGEPCQPSAPGKLNRGEVDAYNEAFEAIQDELAALERLKSNVKEMANDATIFTIPSGPESGSVIHVEDVPIERWQVRSRLLKFGNSETYLCERSARGLKEFAVVEKFPSDSPYARANGDAEVLLLGDDPVTLVEQYAASAQQTLRSMANNLIAQAQRIVWRRYASTSPARVIQAISDRCAEAISSGQKDSNKHSLPRPPSFGISAHV
jgi:hypothetical protein